MHKMHASNFHSQTHYPLSLSLSLSHTHFRHTTSYRTFSRFSLPFSRTLLTNLPLHFSHTITFMQKYPWRLVFCFSYSSRIPSYSIFYLINTYTHTHPHMCTICMMHSLFCWLAWPVVVHVHISSTCGLERQYIVLTSRLRGHYYVYHSTSSYELLFFIVLVFESVWTKRDRFHARLVFDTVTPTWLLNMAAASQHTFHITLLAWRGSWCTLPSEMIWPLPR